MKHASPYTQFEIVRILKRGGIGVLATDTIYGLVGSALKRKTVERIFKVRKRNPKKPLIILISSVADLKKFGIVLDVSMKEVLHKLWPGKVSVIMRCTQKKFAYLHRGKKSLAFRLPASQKLRIMLRKTGPLAAPSANIEGKPSAHTIKKARDYFDDAIDFYVNSGRRGRVPSTLIEIKRSAVRVLREGEVSVAELLNQ